MTLPYRDEEPPLVFGPDGRFLQRIGRVGDGPGEFRRPELVFVGAGDTLYFLDRVLRRLTVYSPELTLARTAPFPMFGDAVRAPDGTFIITTTGRTPTSFDLQRIGATGDTGSRFGGITSPCPPLICGSSDPRVLAMTVDGNLWTIWRFFRYQINGWDSAGGAAASLSLRPDWYHPYDKLSDPSPESPPDPFLAALGQDTAGHLWVVGRAPRAEWKAAIGKPYSSEGQRLHAITGRLFDGVIEVVDPRRTRRLAHLRFPGDPRFLLTGNLIGAIRYTDDGAILVDIFRASFKPRE